MCELTQTGQMGLDGAGVLHTTAQPLGCVLAPPCTALPARSQKPCLLSLWTNPGHRQPELSPPPSLVLLNLLLSPSTCCNVWVSIQQGQMGVCESKAGLTPSAPMTEFASRQVKNSSCDGLNGPEVALFGGGFRCDMLKLCLLPPVG